ncbi:MAG: hypothetical protein ABWZ38_01905 [Candidatus Binatia bacterium]
MPRKQAKKKAAKRIPICPECGSASVIPVIHGVATLEIQRALQAGKAILADREEWEGMTEWYCKTCGCDWGKHSRRFKKPGGVNATRSS